MYLSYHLGLLGYPIAHSLSPAMHNAALVALGLAGEYVAMPVPPEELGAAVRGLHARGFRGVNVTVPHKQTVMQWLDDLSPEARAIGAVNTVVVEPGGRLIGHNTDWRGFADDLAAHEIEVRGRAVVLLGAGGAARACAYALARGGAQVHVFNRTPAAAEALARDFGAAVRARGTADLSQRDMFRDAALIVNATSLGMIPRDDTAPWPEDIPYPAGVPLYDLVYNPLVTRFMRLAEAAGARAVGGLGMLVRQGAAAFELWTGMAAPVDVMKRAASVMR